MSEKVADKKKTFTRSLWAEWMFVNLPYIFFICFLGIVYIFWIHRAERSFRKITTLKREVEDLKSKAMDAEKEVMYESTQSELTKKLEDKGLKPLKKVPIKVKANEK